MTKKLHSRGFTLLELIIVISVISILSLAGIFSFSFVQQNARNAKRKADLQEMAKALESYKARNGIYPDTCTDATVDSCALASTNWRGNCTSYNGSGSYVGNYIPGLAPEFIPQLPRDPREGTGNANGVPGCDTGGPNCYLYRSTGPEYKLLAHCTPEGTMEDTDAFYDSARTCPPNCTGGKKNPSKWAWQVSSGSISASW